MPSNSKIKFDRSQALKAAMMVFWKKGYGGASLSDLTEAMGINKPSMYATFGNKEVLFVKATEHYVESVDLVHRQQLLAVESDLPTRIKAYLSSVISGQCCENTPKGCYISLCVSEAEGECIPQTAVAKIKEVSQFAYQALVDVFTHDEEAKQRNLHVDAQLHARFLITFLSGTAAMARAGTGQEALLPLVTQAMKGIGL
ncbi:MAG: TetR/AcrR family transcriptional regulator [Paraglaciecola sp.]|nr:TetR/AcrR family transcriptional regulator [Paraglaciecola sp.]